MTVATGFDVDYYLDQVGADYYLTAAGEPPGIWAGQGAVTLGLRGQVGGDKASAKTMRALFHYGIGPDGVPLASRQRAPKYPPRAVYAQVEEAIAKRVAALGRFATPEERREIRLQERAKMRTSTPYYDITFSAEKSVSLLYAGWPPPTGAASPISPGRRRAREAVRDAEADTAGILAEETAGELAVLRVADAARREWAEAHAGKAAQARAAEAELRRRDQAERVAQAGQDGQEFRARLPQIVAGAEARYAAGAGKAEPEAMNEPAVWQQPESQAQAEATPEPSGEPGEAMADMDFEAEI